MIDVIIFITSVVAVVISFVFLIFCGVNDYAIGFVLHLISFVLNGINVCTFNDYMSW
jgi:hypothetical protein